MWFIGLLREHTQKKCKRVQEAWHFSKGYPENRQWVFLLNIVVDFRGRHSPDTAGREMSLLGALAPTGSHRISRRISQAGSRAFHYNQHTANNQHRTLKQPF
jgi:hypothetical protein